MKTNVLKLLAGGAAIFVAAQFTDAQTMTNVDTSGDNVTTQNVSRATGIVSVNGAPDAFGVTGVGRTTPANSLTVRNNTGSTNSATTNNAAGANETTGGSGAVYYYHSRNQNGYGFWRAILNRRANEKNNFNNNGNGNGLVARLLRAGSISSGNSSDTNGSSSNSALNFSNGSTQIVNFDLVFFERGGNGGIIKRAVTTSDIIASLGEATSNNFSTNASLVFVGNTNGAGMMAVLDGGNAVDVSSYFSVSNSETQISATAVNNASLKLALLANLQSGNAFRNTFSILYVTFDSNGITNDNGNGDLSFKVNGFNTTTTSTNSGPTEVNANVSGLGRDNGSPAIVIGDITVTGIGQ